MFHISLRHLLVLVTFAALAVASLRYSSNLWKEITLCLTTAVFFTTVIVALVGRGRGQAFAIGMAVVMAGYGYFKFNEKPPTTADFGLPTTSVTVQLLWKTGNNIPDHFLPIAHCWWALLLGYLGGHFARFVYLRRLKEQASARSE